MVQLAFDATTVQPDSGVVGALPAGWYNVQVDESSLEATNSGTGSYLKVRFNVIDGDFAGQKCWHLFTLQHEKQQTVDIARAQLSALCHAINVLQFSQTEQLHSHPLKVKVKVENKEGYAPQNRVTAFRDISFDPGEPAPTKGASAPATGAPASMPAFMAPAAAAPASTPAASAPVTGAMPAQPWDNAAAAATGAPAAATAPTAPTAPAQPAAPVVQTEKQYKMTAAAGDFTREQYHQSGWTDETLVSGGMMEIVEVPVTPPAAPAQPAAPTGAPAAAAAPAAGDVPPWMQK